MTRLALALALSLGVAACDKPVGSPTEADNAANAAAAGNEMMANAAENHAEPARSILRPEVAEPTPEPPKIEPAHLVVGFGASGLKLDDAARAAIDGLMNDPAMKAGGPIILRGHTDSRGHDGDNRVASRRRAEAVRDYLVKKGVEKDRITLYALGEGRPAVPNIKEDGSDDPEARAKNRRVEIDIALPIIVVPPAVTPVDPAIEKK